MGEWLINAKRNEGDETNDPFGFVNLNDLNQDQRFAFAIVRHHVEIGKQLLMRIEGYAGILKINLNILMIKKFYSISFYSYVIFRRHGQISSYFGFSKFHHRKQYGMQGGRVHGQGGQQHQWNYSPFTFISANWWQVRRFKRQFLASASKQLFILYISYYRRVQVFEFIL